MAEAGIVRKAEAALVPARVSLVAPTGEAAIALLPDCGAPHAGSH